MVLTRNATFLHIPKTGGTWVRRVIGDSCTTYNTKHSLLVPDSYKDKPVFTFVRNPWAWHVSFYNYIKYGQRDKEPLSGASLYRNLLWKHILWKHVFSANVTFEEFVRTFTGPDQYFKDRLAELDELRIRYLSLEKKKTIGDMSDNFKYDIITNIWKETGKGIYQCTVDAYTAPTTRIGKTESIRTDLKLMLASVDELTSDIEQKIDILAPVNFSIPTDYRKYYTAETRQLVAESAKSMIEKFNYDF